MSAGALRATSDPVPGLIRKIAVPAGTGMLFQTFFNVVDTWYAGLISTQALAALAISFPVFFIVIALMVGIGFGASALIANAIGAEDRRLASRLFGQAILLALIAGVIVAIYGLLAADPLFRLAGAIDETLALAKLYLVPILLASGLFLLVGVCNGFLSAQGDSKTYRNALVGGSLLNVALNPLFMFGIGPIPGLGVLGIAISTILIQGLQLVYLWRQALQSELGSCFSIRDLKADPVVMGALLRQALPVGGQMLTTGIGLFAITYFMGRHGETAIAAYGIGLRIEQVAMLPMIGLNTAALTLIGQNYGARKWDRMIEAARLVLGYGVFLMAVSAILVWLFRLDLMALFADDADVIHLGGAYLAIAVLNFKAYAILIIGSGILQAMKRPVFALFIGLFRHVFGPLVVLWLLDPVLGFGLPGIYWGIFAIAWIGALTVLFYVRYRLQRIGVADLPLSARAVQISPGRE